MVDLAISARAMKDARATMIETVHGRARLRKGLLARLSFAVITSTLPSKAKHSSKRIHACREAAQTEACQANEVSLKFYPRVVSRPQSGHMFIARFPETLPAPEERKVDFSKTKVFRSSGASKV